MSLQAWLLFCATETILCFTPGPAVLLVISESLSSGAGAGLSASLGILAANALYFALSATSLGAVLVASWQVFVAIKWMGAAYLVWLGTRMLFARLRSSPPVDRPDGVARPWRQSFSLAVLTQGANPKA